MRYRKKPVEVDAIQWTGSEASQLAIDAFFQEAESQTSIAVHWRSIDRIMIRTLEGTMAANVGDWIIKGVRGEYYPCKPDIFEETHEPA